MTASIRKNTSVVIALLLFCALSAQAQVISWKQIKAPPLPPFKPQLPVRVELPNGMIIFLQEDHELPLIDGTARIRGGARDLSAHKTGMMGIYGQAWRTGGTASKTGDQLDDFLEARAAKVETSGGSDSTSISFSSLKEDFNDVFPIFVDLLLHPEFREDKVDLAKKQMKTAISRRNDEASEIAAREARKIVYGADNPYARVAEYWTVDAVTRQDLLDWHKKYVHPNNIILGIVGDFDAKQMEDRLRQAFAQWPQGPPAPKTKIEFSQPKPGIYFVPKDDVTQSTVDLLALGTTRRNPDYYAITVMNELFGGGFSSRLFTSIRSKQGLAYSVGGGLGANFDYPGVFRLTLGTKSGSTVQSVDSLYGEIKRLIADPGSPEEVKRAKDNILNSFVFNFDSKEKVLQEEMAYEFYGYPLDFLEKFRSGIESVTPQDVARVVKKYVDPQEFSVLVVGRSEDFDRPLSTLGKVQTLDITIPTEPPGKANAAVSAAATSNPEGKALAQKVVEHLGGKQKLASVKALQQMASVTLKTPQGELTIDTDSTTVYPDKLRVTMKTPMGEMTRVVTPEDAFMVVPGRGTNPMPAPMKAEALKDTKHDLIFIASHLDDPGYSFRAEGTEKVGESEGSVLEISGEGVTTRFVVDSQTGAVLSSSYQSTGMQGPVQRQVVFSDWQQVDGINLPFKRVVNENGEQAAITQIKQLKVNPQVESNLFAKPPAQ